MKLNSRSDIGIFLNFNSIIFVVQCRQNDCFELDTRAPNKFCNFHFLFSHFLSHEFFFCFVFGFSKRYHKRLLIIGIICRARVGAITKAFLFLFSSKCRNEYRNLK